VSTTWNDAVVDDVSPHASVATKVAVTVPHPTGPNWGAVVVHVTIFEQTSVAKAPPCVFTQLL
jgi:hypothetical protein